MPDCTLLLTLFLLTTQLNVLSPLYSTRCRKFISARLEKSNLSSPLSPSFILPPTLPLPRPPHPLSPQAPGMEAHRYPALGLVRLQDPARELAKAITRDLAREPERDRVPRLLPNSLSMLQRSLTLRTPILSFSTPTPPPNLRATEKPTNR